MEVDKSSELESEVLRVLRSRLSSGSIAEATLLCELVAGFDGTSLGRDGDVVFRVSDALKEAVRLLPSEHQYLVETIQLLAGLDERTSSRAVKRNFIIKLEASAMTYEQDRWGAQKRIGVRRMQQLERTLIAPVVLQALRDHLGTYRPAEHRWRDCEVDVRLFGDGEQGVLMRTDLTFTTSQTTLLVAVTSDGTLADGLCVRHPELTEVFVPSEGLPPEMALGAKVRYDGVLYEIDPVEATLRDVSDDLATTLRETGISEIYAVRVPSELQAERNELHLTATQRLDVAEGFCYWTSPREAFVRSIRVDYRGFPMRAAHKFRVRPRLGFPVEVLERGHLGQHELRVDSWVNAGCGFEVQWSEAEHDA